LAEKNSNDNKQDKNQTGKQGNEIRKGNLSLDTPNRITEALDTT